MTTPSDKAERLIALALNAAASPEEARTAAMAAVRLIRDGGLLEHGGQYVARSSDGHCAGCRCYSSDRQSGEYTVRTPRKPDWEVWEDQQQRWEDEHRSREDRVYAQWWDRVWGKESAK